ncbi:hypothetical protein P8452_18015 [Trifolium repens]|nr:hypothetical protein P8452_18015 [Trifolium repens]
MYGPDNITEEKVGVNYRALRNHFCGLMNLGQKNREVDSTVMNDQSSRSHRCVQISYCGAQIFEIYMDWKRKLLMLHSVEVFQRMVD